MKKIAFTAILILMAGMFVGCASTSMKSTSTNIQTKKYSSEEEIFKEIYSILEKPVITQDDIDIIWHLPFGPHESKSGIMNYYESVNPPVKINPDNFVPIETKRTDYTGRITNKTDKKITFLIGNGNCGSYNQDKWYYFDVEPGETGYFVLPYAIAKFTPVSLATEPFISVYTLPTGNMKGDWNIFFGMDDCKFHSPCITKGETREDIYRNWYRLPLFNEVMKNHSLEIDYYSDDKVEYKFVEAFEYSWED